METFYSVQQAIKFAENHFAEHFDYVGEFQYRYNKDGVTQFYSIENQHRFHTFDCIIIKPQTNENKR
jgi:hypothetical protein